MRALMRCRSLPFALPLVFLSASILAACGGGSGSANVSALPSDMEATPELRAGSPVTIEKNGQWLPGTVVTPEAGGFAVVNFDGFGPEWNERVSPDRLRAREGAGGAAAPAATARDFRVGEKVLVKSQNRLVLGTVMAQLAADSWRVHYDGYGPEIAETVGPDRLRRMYSGTSQRALGQPVGVDVGGGRIMAGKVLAVVAADRWLVRFDGFGPEYDQEVGAAGLREVPKAPAAAPTPATSGTIAVAPLTAAPPTSATPDKPGADKPGAAGKPAPEKPAITAVTGPLQPGEAVLVTHRGSFHPAVLVSAGPGGAWRVKYDKPAGGPPEEDIPADRVARATAQPKGTAYAANQPVFIEWHGMFVTGKIVKESGKGQYKVRFDGMGPEGDEVLQTKRLRPRP
jgi:hypothetical protein